MADRPISSLTELDVGSDGSGLWDESLFVLEQDGQAMSLTGESLKRYLNKATGVTSVDKTGTSGLVDTYTVSYNIDNDTTNFTVTNAKSITGVTKTSTTNYLVDNYVISFNDGTSFNYTVTNGKSIVNVEYVSSTPASGNVVGYDTYRINFNDNTSTTFNAYYGKDIYLNGDPVTNYAKTINGTSHPATSSSDWKSSLSELGSLKGYYIWTWDRLTYNTGQTEDRFSVVYSGQDGEGTLNSVNGVAPVAGSTAITITGEDIDVSTTDNRTIPQVVTAIEGIINTEISALTTAVGKLETYVINVNTISQLPHLYPDSGTDSNIESDMVCIKCILSNPIAQASDWTITTNSNGTLEITGTITSGETTNATLYLMKSR